MEVLATNVGLPSEIEFNGRKVKTSMVKTASSGPLQVRKLSIDGDRFADPQFHGRPFSVVYAYGWPSLREYAKRIAFKNVPMGAVGENLTLTNLDESQVFIGDTFKVGSVRLKARAPRIPCVKLNFRFQNALAQKEFIFLEKPGVYFSVEQEGQIAVGDSLVKLSDGSGGVSIREIYRYFTRIENPTEERARQIMTLPDLPDQYRQKFDF